MATIEERLAHVEQLLNSVSEAGLAHIDLREALKQKSAENEIEELKKRVAILEARLAMTNSAGNTPESAYKAWISFDLSASTR